MATALAAVEVYSAVMVRRHTGHQTRAVRTSWLVPVLVLATSLASPACKGKHPAAAEPDMAPLKIVKASWSGADGRATLDVTNVVAGLVKDNALSVEASPQVLGDPSPFMVKELRVEWSKGGVVARRVVKEGQTLKVAPGERPVPIRVVVRKAEYGDLGAGNTVDVTQKVDELLVDNVLSLVPSDALFGDPAAGQQKQLRVDYTLDGVAKSKTGREGETLTISPASP